MGESTGLEIEYRWNGSETRVVAYSRVRLVFLACCAVASMLGLGFQIGRISLQPSVSLQSTVPEHQMLTDVPLPSNQKATSIDGGAVPSAPVAMPAQTSVLSEPSEDRSPAARKLSIKSLQAQTSEDSIELSFALVNLTKEMLSGSITVTARDAVSDAVSFSMKKTVTKTLLLDSRLAADSLANELPVTVTIRDRGGEVMQKETLQIKMKVTNQTEGSRSEQLAPGSNE